MAATESFDPYRDWLGIDPGDGPRELASSGPDHYRLLGLARFEADAGKIAQLADARMAHVRTFQVGPRGRMTQKLLNELSAAKTCLLSPPAKAAYDAQLARALATAIGPPIVPVPPPAPPPVAGAARTPASEIIMPPGEGADPAATWARPVLAITSMALVAIVAWLGWAVWRQRTRPGPSSAPAVVSTAPLATVESMANAQRPTVQLQEGSGEVTLTAATAVFAGGVELRHVGTTAVLGPWTSDDAAALWRLRLIRPGFFHLELKYAAAAEADGAELVIRAGTSAKTLTLRATGGLDQFISDMVTIAIPSGGEHDLALAAKDPLTGDWLHVESVRLIPVGGITPPAILPDE